jgi:hypothetical protein
VSIATAGPGVSVLAALGTDLRFQISSLRPEICPSIALRVVSLSSRHLEIPKGRHRT